MDNFTTMHLKGIKELLFVGLDFMASNFSIEDVTQYIIINRESFSELGIAQSDYNSWILEWRDKRG